MTGEPAELSLSGIARHWAVRDPERRALAEGDLAVTYGHWTELGDLVAQGLRRAGVAPGDRVLFLGRNGLVYPVLALGVSRNRGVIVGVNFRLGAREIAAIVADCEPSLVFVEREFLQIYELASELARFSVDTISYDGHSDLRSLELWWAEAPDVEMPRTEPGDIAALVYTSGTTGEPTVWSFAIARWSPRPGRESCRIPRSRGIPRCPPDVPHLGSVLDVHDLLRRRHGGTAGRCDAAAHPGGDRLLPDHRHHVGPGAHPITDGSAVGGSAGLPVAAI